MDFLIELLKEFLVSWMADQIRSFWLLLVISLGGLSLVLKSKQKWTSLNREDEEYKTSSMVFFLKWGRDIWHSASFSLEVTPDERALLWRLIEGLKGTDYGKKYLFTGEPGVGKTLGVLCWMETASAAPTRRELWVYKRLEVEPVEWSVGEVHSFFSELQSDGHAALSGVAAIDDKLDRDPNGIREILKRFSGVTFVLDIDVRGCALHSAQANLEKIEATVEAAEVPFRGVLITRSDAASLPAGWKKLPANHLDARQLRDRRWQYELHGGNLGIRRHLNLVSRGSVCRLLFSVFWSLLPDWSAKQIYRWFFQSVEDDHICDFRHIALREHREDFGKEERAVLESIAVGVPSNCGTALQRLIERGVLNDRQKIRSRVVETYLRRKVKRDTRNIAVSSQEQTIKEDREGGAVMPVESLREDTEKAEFIDAMLNAFRTRLALQQMLSLRLGINLNELIGENVGLRDAVFALVDNAEAEGWKRELIAKARESRPRNPALLAFGQRYGLTALSYSPPELEAIIKNANTYLPINDWREKLGRVESAVCRVEVTTNKGMVFGTGFLIAPDVVMTNYHVVEAAIVGEQGKSTADGCRATSRDIVLRFDYKQTTSATVINPGQVFQVPAQDWLIDASPYVLGGTPSPDELDYALLRIDGRPGCETIGNVAEPGSPRRGWIELTDGMYDFPPNSAIMIVQHPKAEPLKLAIDTEAVIGVNPEGTQVRYSTNTEHGSSGSPCFNINWELVALHHSGDPSWTPTYNAGTPIRAILARLRRRNLDHISSSDC